VAGFSQGCAMSLMTGLRHTERLAGIVGLSGYLPIAATTAAERHAANHETPVFLAHGRQDPVVPMAAAQRSRDALAALGYTVEWHEYTMAHSVCMEEIADLNRFAAARACLTPPEAVRSSRRCLVHARSYQKRSVLRGGKSRDSLRKQRPRARATFQPLKKIDGS
jgi:pimeloyl-ACP methyl ester carboxylesterase